MAKIYIKDLGEYIPGKFNSMTLDKLKEFVIVPYHIAWYKSSQSKKVFPLFVQEISDLNPTNFVVPGILTRNPFFDHSQIKYFIAYMGDKPAGRIMAFIDYNYNIQHNTETGWFGLFESTDNKEVAFELMDKAAKYLSDNRCKKIIGPAKFNAGGEIGCLVSGYENKPYFMEPYNAPYYKDYFEDMGFAKENDWYSMNTDELLAGRYMEKIERLHSRINGTRRDISTTNGFFIRNVNFKNMKKEIRAIRILYNEIWNSINHPQQPEMTEKEFDILAAGIKAVALEDLIFIVEKENEPVGVSVSIPDINEVISEYDGRGASSGSSFSYNPSRHFFSAKDFKRDFQIYSNIQKRLRQKNFSGVRFLILGIKEPYRKTGLDASLYYRTFRTAKDLGFKHGSGSQLADINTDIINPMFKLGKRSMTWRVYNFTL
ncbi:MAG: hypothetical protein FJW66_01700 [Actinobacteria bacterium]|nr:hypothetical protein [Actinomycetota bacterium]